MRHSQTVVYRSAMALGAQRIVTYTKSLTISLRGSPNSMLRRWLLKAYCNAIQTAACAW